MRPARLLPLAIALLGLAGCVSYMGVPIPDTPAAHRCADACSADHGACLNPPTRPELPKQRALTKQSEPILTRDDEQQRTERCDRSYKTCLEACVPGDGKASQ